LKIFPCSNNSICEVGEYGTSDCPNCNDNNSCTKDFLNYTTLNCIHDEIIPCCGNGISEKEETCSSCFKDVKCKEGRICCNGKCINVCKNNLDCLSDDPAKIGKCLNPSSCYAHCNITISSTVEIKEKTYSTHGLKFNIALIEYGEKLSYSDKSGEIEYYYAQNYMKLLKYYFTVQCIEEDCDSFYSSNFLLMDKFGNTYESQCPTDYFNNCIDKNQPKAMLNGIKDEKIGGILVFNTPKITNYVFLIYKFSKNEENPKTLKFVRKLD
jgi:hypothetical protein